MRDRPAPIISQYRPYLTVSRPRVASIVSSRNERLARALVLGLTAFTSVVVLGLILANVTGL